MLFDKSFEAIIIEGDAFNGKLSFKLTVFD